MISAEVGSYFPFIKILLVGGGDFPGGPKAKILHS